MGQAILEQLDTYGPDHCRQLDYAQACAYTRQITRTHAENFTVVSRLLPQQLRDDFHHVYSFCRWADDLGDETGDPKRSLELLQWWRRELELCYADQPRHPVFVALARTIQTHDIPRKPFDDLIDAFIQDQSVTRYRTWEQVLDYCTRSADPVGRLVLYLCGYRDPHRQSLSDATCTALQLTNFWQDVRRDVLERDRIYIPETIARTHGLDLALMAQVIRIDADREPDCGSCATSAAVTSSGMNALRQPFRHTLRELVDRTWPLFERGRGLWPTVEPAVRSDIQLFTLGGEATLRLIQRHNYDTMRIRPRLSRTRKAMLVARVMLTRLLHGRRPW